MAGCVPAAGCSLATFTPPPGRASEHHHHGCLVEKLNTEEEQKHLSCFLRLLWRSWMMSNMDLQTGSRLVPQPDGRCGASPQP